MASVASIPYSSSPAIMDHQLESCGGCKNPVDDGNGVVVAFGFKCAKCANRVSPDTNLLLLSDGSPVCAACSYNCAVCKKPISHEAIMTGDESYHAACFTCKTCARHIGELVFAKTTQGIYCMSCHNERVARSRRHAEQRKNKHKPPRDKDTKDRLREKPSTMTLRDLDRISTQSLTATLQNSRQHGESSHRPVLPYIDASPATLRPPSSLPSPTTTTAVGSSLHSPQSAHENPISLPHISDTLGPRRKSFDGGVRPANALLSPESASPSSRVPTTAGKSSRAEKRSSINPATRLDWISANPSLDSQVFTSPTDISAPAESTPKESSGSQDRSRDSGERSSSPRSPPFRDSKGSSKDSSAIDIFYSPPTSPSASSHSHQRSQQVEYLLSQSGGPPSGRKYSLPDNTWPPMHQHPSNQSHLPTSRRQSPPRPHTSHDDKGGFAQRQESLLPELSTSSASEEEPPSLLPYTESASEGSESVDSHVSKELDRPRTDEHASSALGLPRMSFLKEDTSFHDLFQLGARQSTLPVESTTAVDQGSTSTSKPNIPRSSPPNASTSMDDTHRREENNEAGPSKSVTSTVAASVPPLKAPAVTKLSLPPSPLTTLPRRNESLSRKMSARKPVPKAIVLPDTFEEDMAFDLGPSSNGTSPAGTPRRPDAPPAKSLDSVVKSTRRPGSAGVGSSAAPSSPPSKARRASVTLSSPLSPDTITPPMRTTSHSVTLTDSGSGRTLRPAGAKHDASELVAKRLKEALADAQENGATSVRLDREFLEVIYMVVKTGRESLRDIRGKFDGMRRASQQYIDGLSVAQEEYDNELVARREAEAEVTRLKVQLSGQTARLTELSAGEHKRDVVEQWSRDLSANLHGLERDLSKLKAERDLTVAEVEELAAAKTSFSGQTDVTLQRSLTSRFDGLKAQYKRELEPLVQQRDALMREIHELKEERNICLEETTALNARNEELADLNSRTTQIESGARGPAPSAWSPMPASMGPPAQLHTPSTPKSAAMLAALPSSGLTSAMLSASVGASTVLPDEREEPKATPTDKKKWFKPSREAIKLMSDGPPVPEKEFLRHNFQQLTVLRFARCDHCGDKMWGTQLRCNICNIGCHIRCAGNLTLACVNEPRPHNDILNIAPLQPSMFGRDLIEQVRADSAKEHRDIPMVVEKCILAVEHMAMDYEGIYRKTGGSAQSKAITQLFERGNYDAFDLCNLELFNDISSVTSVLKTYFRQLPNPLLTHALHEAFIGAATLREPRGRAEALSSLVYQLPSEHFHTLRYLMLHLYHVQSRSAENLMNARNLGVVFGPTLMRSSDPSREYADMAGKALAIEWLIENARSVFRDDS
ncbi:hypothetical protein JB92DRAFT_2920340 [Gautieria morchelliformis]|nr:hypothetical protein JB92DRAFT_2920340 [Gautieria morchelliformis]